MATTIGSWLKGTRLGEIVASYIGAKAVTARPAEDAFEARVYPREALENLGAQVVTGPSLEGWKPRRFYHFPDLDVSKASLRSTDLLIEGDRVRVLKEDEVVKGSEYLSESIFGVRANKHQLKAGDVVVSSENSKIGPTLYLAEEFSSIYGKNPLTGDYESKPRLVVALNEVCDESGFFSLGGRHKIKVSQDHPLYLVETGLGKGSWMFMTASDANRFGVQVDKPVRPDALPAHLRPAGPAASRA